MFDLPRLGSSNQVDNNPCVEMSDSSCFSIPEIGFERLETKSVNGY